VHDPIALAVPLFFALIAIEMVWAKRKGVSVYRFADSLTDLGCGMTQQITHLLWGLTQLAIYAWLFEHARFVTWKAPAVPWVLAFVLVDFAYYWWHRFSHETNFLWAVHAVHHQSEDYNLAVALRQAVLSSWTSLPFYLPLAFLGVPTLVFATVNALSTLYQFWIHTQLVGRIGGPLEKILNLPHHHRVHHAINTQYLDKNYGATLIVWDWLFGTYADEVEKPVYGVTKPLASFDPMWAQVQYWFQMVEMARAARRPLDKLRVLFASPAWKPEGYVAAAPPIQGRTKYERPLGARTRWWIGANFVLVVGATFSAMMWHAVIAVVPLAVTSVAVLAALFAFGSIIEGRRWAVVVDVGRLALGAAAVALLLHG
jgi:sterol desaturase/sphingolipid hydroxylase (fatty acid hydroxylase superfamily)